MEKAPQAAVPAETALHATKQGCRKRHLGLRRPIQFTGHALAEVAYEALETFVAGVAFAALAIAARTVASVRLTICWVTFENCS